MDEESTLETARAPLDVLTSANADAVRADIIVESINKPTIGVPTGSLPSVIFGSAPTSSPAPAA